MSEHYCNQCKTGEGDTCTLTGASHPDYGIECPSFGQKEIEMNETHRSTNQTPTLGAAPPIRPFESGMKDTNPKDALGVKKAPLSTLPTGPMYEVALAMLEGARKYGRHNYRVMGVKASVYYDATMGHLTAWWEGEDVDPASGLHHLAKAMACLAVVRDSEMMGNWVDDRPPRYPDASKLMRNHPAVGDILKRYPECKRPFTWHTTNRTAPTEGGFDPKTTQIKGTTCGQY